MPHRTDVQSPSDAVDAAVLVLVHESTTARGTSAT